MKKSALMMPLLSVGKHFNNSTRPRTIRLTIISRTTRILMLHAVLKNSKADLCVNMYTMKFSYNQHSAMTNKIFSPK